MAMNWAQTTYAKLTLDQKLGQLMVSYVDNEEDIFDLARRGALGGLYSVCGNTVAEAAAWVAGIQRMSPVPLLICADFERGNEFAGGTALPTAMAVGATGDPNWAHRAGRITALETRAMGFRLLGSPVADINNNPRNPIVNTRSYGDNPELVSRMAVAYLQAVQNEGMYACVKHFPGHGNMAVDSHRVLPTISDPLEQLEAMELAPFQAGIDNGVKSVMPGHIRLSALDPEHPATLSRKVLQGLLRKRMGFEGLILSDAMEMHAVAHNYDFDAAVGLAVEGGCDAVLPSQSIRTHEALKKAYADGVLTENRLQESVLRILSAKEELQLAGSYPDPEAAARVGADPEHKRTARQIAEASIAVYVDEAGLLPLLPARSKGIVAVTVANYDASDIKSSLDKAQEKDRFEKALRDNYRVQAIHHITPQQARPFDSIQEHDVDAVVVGVFARLMAYNANSGWLPKPVQDLLEHILQKAKNCYVVSFDNPYPLMDVEGLHTCICAFSHAAVSIDAAVKTLSGAIPAQGCMPGLARRE